jgi:hypothetical protein
MKRASYREAIKWIARNDESANDDDIEATRDLISVSLIADLFDVAAEIVAQEVHRKRAQIKKAETRQKRRENTFVEVASLTPGGSVECPHCHWGISPHHIAQHIREKH